MTRSTDVVIVGAGAVGAACAYFAAREGLRVEVLDRGQICSGSTSACEGNVLVSDKEAGHDLDLALHAQQVWRDDLGPFGDLWEFHDKGGLIVSATQDGADGLAELSARQREAGIEVTHVPADRIHDYEPHISTELVAGAFYPQDAQVQPMLLTAQLLRLARENGTNLTTNTEVTSLLQQGDRVIGVRTAGGDIHCGHVVNATGAWAGQFARSAGIEVPVVPRRGFVLVTEPLPPTVFHKVYSGDYVASTLSSDAELQTSTVVESTRAGTILIGSSRERAGFDRQVSLDALRQIATKAAAIYPSLRTTKIIRSYLGFRPYCTDHLPVIGHDPLAPGLWHATGHEGAGIGLSVGTGKLLAQALTDQQPDLDLTPFTPERFAEVATS